MEEVTPETAAADPMIGQVLHGRFHIVELIAKGGMGAIYKARQEPLGRMVALKLLSVGPAAPEGFRERFMLEASVTARLSHRNIVRVFDYGVTDDGIHFIAMELIDGRPLFDVLRDESPMPPARALHITRQIVSALVAAHDEGVLHRDIKPANVLITTDGDEYDFVKVVDFGLVKVLDGEDVQTSTGIVLGSPHYMPPEQIAGLELTDERSDIYPVGILLFNMLSGRRPFRSKSISQLFYAHVNEPFPSIADLAPTVVVPPMLERIVRKCVAKQADDRFQTMRELGRVLAAAESMVDSPDKEQTTLDPSGSAAAPRQTTPAQSEPGEPNTPVMGNTVEFTTSQPSVAMVGAISGAAAAAATLFVAVGAALAWMWMAPSHRVQTVADTEPVAVEADAISTEDTPQSAPTQVADVDATPAPGASEPDEALKKPRIRMPGGIHRASRRGVQRASATADETEPGKVTWTGDAADVWLERSGRRFDTDRAVLPGKYTIKASFDHAADIEVGTVSVRPGEAVELRCSSFLNRCK